MPSGQKAVFVGGWHYVSIFHIFISKQLQFKQIHWLRVWSPLPVYLSLLYDHFVGLLSHDATMEPDLSPVDDWNTQTPLGFPTSPDKQRRAPEQTLRCLLLPLLLLLLGLQPFLFMVRRERVRESTCAQRGWVHRAGAAQNIHSLTPFLSKKKKNSDTFKAG